MITLPFQDQSHVLVPHQSGGNADSTEDQKHQKKFGMRNLATVTYEVSIF